jgi:Fic/DOC family
MASPSEKLADSLDKLKELQNDGIIAIKADAITRTHKERLLQNGFIEEVHKGWYITASPETQKGDSTTWYSNYWGFCAQFLNARFEQSWSISPEQSLLLHGGNTAVPAQMIIKSPEANNYNINLPYNTSLFLMRGNLPPIHERTEKDGIHLFSLPAALVRASPNTFAHYPIDVRAALSLVRDASSILALLLEGGHSAIAGRIAGAFRSNNQARIADEIIKTMQSIGYVVREVDPFQTKLAISLSNKEISPYGNRIKLMWQAMRDKIIPFFPPAPGLPADKKAYLKAVEKIYVTDAYHSLSIEKYKVTPELIERVRKGNWNAKGNDKDRKQRDAMAARGYWDAFKVVERSIGQILGGKNGGTVADDDHGEWFRALFATSVAAGLLKPSDLSGYRNHQVYIGRSMHTPLNKEAIRDAMPVLFELLAEEKEASVRAVLGHFIFVFIHPYMDGNGRMGRFLMNVMLASGGYPWTVIPVERRNEYMHALEKASVGQDIGPFAKFLGYLVGEGMKGTPVAKI